MYHLELTPKSYEEITGLKLLYSTQFVAIEEKFVFPV
jgi:hypothetical protein